VQNNVVDLSFDGSGDELGDFLNCATDFCQVKKKILLEQYTNQLAFVPPERCPVCVQIIPVSCAGTREDEATLAGECEVLFRFRSEHLERVFACPMIPELGTLYNGAIVQGELLSLFLYVG
jgi:hypothetical protein